MAAHMETKPPTVSEPVALERRTKGPPVSEARLFYAGIAVAAIWISVTLASIFSPDFVSGTQQDHIPLAGLVDWLWGAAATGSVLLAFRRTAEQGRGVWMGIAIGVAAIWATVALVSIFVPQMVTGTDPTRIPMGALIAPIGGRIATKFIANLVAGKLEI